MKISNKLPQFENYPTLFIISGEYEATFLVAKDGETKEYSKLDLNPRSEAMEKQVFINKSGGEGSGAVSHEERYKQDLKFRFQKELSKTVESMVKNEKIREICIMAPRHAANSLKKCLSNQTRKLIHLTIFGLHIKQGAKKILEIYQKELSDANHYITQAKEQFSRKNPENMLTH